MKIQITEREYKDNNFHIEVLLDNKRYDVELPDPRDDSEEKQLEWYFEQYISEPFVTKVRVNKAKKILIM